MAVWRSPTGRVARLLVVLVFGLAAAPGYAQTEAERKAIIAELDATYRAMPDGDVMRVIAEEAPEDYAWLLSELANAFLTSPSQGGLAGMEIMTRYRRNLATYAFSAPDDLVRTSLLARVEMGELLQDEPRPCRALIQGEPLVLPSRLARQIEPLSIRESEFSMRALLQGRERAQADRPVTAQPTDADWGQVVETWISNPENAPFIPIMEEERVDDPLYCAAVLTGRMRADLAVDVKSRNVGARSFTG